MSVPDAEYQKALEGKLTPRAERPTEEGWYKCCNDGYRFVGIWYRGSGVLYVVEEGRMDRAWPLSDERYNDCTWTGPIDLVKLLEVVREVARLTAEEALLVQHFREVDVSEGHYGDEMGYTPAESAIRVMNERKEKLAAILLERDGHRGYAETVRHLREENTRLQGIVCTDMLLEKLANQEHERWSGWMRWMFDNWTAENVVRWKQQMVTVYVNLPEHSKESDRKEARKTLAVFRKAAAALTPPARTEGGAG